MTEKDDLMLSIEWDKIFGKMKEKIIEYNLATHFISGFNLNQLRVQITMLLTKEHYLRKGNIFSRQFLG